MPGWAGAADAAPDQRLPAKAAAPPATVARRTVRRSIGYLRGMRAVPPKLPTVAVTEVNVRRGAADDGMSPSLRSGTLAGVTRTYPWFRQPAAEPVTSP
ncbi:hypothetical protein TPA0907_04640 [Micromonospora humidisoli]|nr:hypothetical protein TPA0907_04640 [Micromonospora sp. AKA109]